MSSLQNDKTNTFFSKLDNELEKIRKGEERINLTNNEEID